MYKIGDVVIETNYPWQHPITLDKYPANWVSLASAQEIEAAGLVWYPDPPPVPPVVTLDEAKATKIQAIDMKTATLMVSGMTYDSRQFSMSESAQRNWALIGTGVALGMISDQNLPTISDIHEVPYVFASMAGVSSFLQAFAAYMTAAQFPLGSGRVLKAQVAACTTVEQVDAIIDDR